MISRSVIKGFLRKDVPLSLAATIVIGLFGHFNVPDGTTEPSRWNWFIAPLSNFYHWASAQVGGEIVLLGIVFITDLALCLGVHGLILAYRRVKVATDEDKIRWLSGWWLMLNSFILTVGTLGLSYLLELLSGMSDEKRVQWLGQPLVDWKHDHRFLWVAIPLAVFWFAFAVVGHQIRVRTWPETKRSYGKVETKETADEVDLL